MVNENTGTLTETQEARGIRWRGWLLAGLREHGLPLFIYVLLSLVLSWPVIAHFSDLIAGGGSDARHNLWVLWHTKEALLGQQPLFDAPFLFYPAGASLLLNALGPVTGIFALPFWPFGPEAAHNGALILSLSLTGYFMYLLARSQGLNRPVAFFAGLVLLVAPMHLAGIYGHMTKLFLGMMPLALLALLNTLDLKRSRWWAVIAGLALLGTLLHTGTQFVFAALAIAYFSVLALFNRPRDEWGPLLRRIIWLGIWVLVLVGPLLLAIVQDTVNVPFPVDRRQEAFNNQPDVVELFLPARHSRLFGSQTIQFLDSRQIRPNIETVVSLPWAGLALCGVALLKDRKRAWPWVGLLAIFAVLALGPTVKILGKQTFTEYNLPVIMPYALLTELPGLGFMRTPGRFIQMAYLAFGMGAAFGLQALGQRWPRLAWPLVLAATAILLLETWPNDWPLGVLAETPEFYAALGEEDEMFGVLDLPIIPMEGDYYASYAVIYHIHQFTHGKGIASGYLSRVPDVHPLFPCLIPEMRPAEPDVLVNGRPVACYANTLFDLDFFNYRYVVRHKPQPGDNWFTVDSWGEAETQRFVDLFFAGQEPLVEDDLVEVYEVRLPEAIDREPVMGLRENWYAAESAWRWASSPAGIFLSAPRPVSATLEIVPEAIYAPAEGQAVGSEGVLHPMLNGEPLPAVTIRQGEVARIPLNLPAGVHELTLALEAGNFRPAEFSGTDWRLLSFSIKSLNLVVE